MAKIINTPEVILINLQSCDVIATSDPVVMGKSSISTSNDIGVQSRGYFYDDED